MSKKSAPAKKTSRPASARRRTATPAEGGEVKVGKGIFYIVYTDSYVSDTEILPRGVYHTETPIERLDASAAKYVRRFEESIPDKIVHEIAATLKISVEDSAGNYRDTAEILEEMVQEL